MADETTIKYLDDVRSKELLENITKNVNFNIPDVDLNSWVFSLPGNWHDLAHAEPNPPSRDSVTNIDKQKYEQSKQHTIEGTGSFDVFMDAYQRHLEREVAEKRISGADYTKVYTELIAHAMDQAIQFELNREKARFEGFIAQAQAISSAAAVEKAKIELAMAKAQAETAKAQYAATVAQLGILDANYGNALVQRDNILAQTEKLHEETTLTVKNQALVEQQTTSFKRRDEYNAVKLQSDAYTIQKSVDEGTVAPTVFQSAQINNAITKHLSNVGL